jgi:rhodanese-related sulfurtransferase
MTQQAFYQAKLAYETDAWDLSEMIRRQAEIVIVDTRSPEAYTQEHIPTAINLPHRKMSEESSKALDRDKTYITYCDGIGCNASTKGALKLSMLGFNVKELLGGLDWRKRDGHATEGREASAGEKVSCGC